MSKNEAADLLVSTERVPISDPDNPELSGELEIQTRVVTRMFLRDKKNRVVAESYAIQNPKEQYSQVMGETVALGRLIKNSGIGKEEAKATMKEVFKQIDDYRRPKTLFKPLMIGTSSGMLESSRPNPWKGCGGYENVPSLPPSSPIEALVEATVGETTSQTPKFAVGDRVRLLRVFPGQFGTIVADLSERAYFTVAIDGNPAPRGDSGWYVWPYEIEPLIPKVGDLVRLTAYGQITSGNPVGKIGVIKELPKATSLLDYYIISIQDSRLLVEWSVLRNEFELISPDLSPISFLGTVPVAE